MKFKSGLVTQASGSIGGMTASRNRGGNYLRGRAIPTNPSTMLQAAVREGLGMLANMWATLTQAQRDGWATYALNVPVINSLGDSIKLTALNMFIRSNAPLNQAGLDLVVAAPTEFNLGMTPEVESFTLEAGGVTPTATITWGAQDLTGDDRLLFYLSKPLSPTIKYYNGPYRFVKSEPGDSSSVVIATADYPFPYAAGNKVVARVQVCRLDGRLSQSAKIDTIAIVGV